MSHTFGLWMRAVIQRVLEASVTVEDRVISAIKEGYCILIGINSTDTYEDADYLIRKILSLRLFGSDQEVEFKKDQSDRESWKLSISDANLEILCLSQFTLYARCHKGSKPDFHEAMPPALARTFYDAFVENLQGQYRKDKVKTGVFGKVSKVYIVNNGPTTIILDSKRTTSNSTSSLPLSIAK